MYNNSPHLKNIKDLIEKAKSITLRTGPKTVSVAVAENEEVIEALYEAKKIKIANSILYGNKDKILPILSKLNIKEDEFEIVHCQNESTALYEAVKAVDTGKADILMKGIVQTAKILRMVLSKEFNLRGRRIMSHVGILDIKTYHKLLALTDGGMVIKPTIKQKIEMIHNAVMVMRSLGIDKPKVAVLSAVDIVNLKMPSSTEAAIISKMWERNQIKDCIVDGPITLDLALREVSTDYMGFKSIIDGDADIILVDSIETGNVLVKTLTQFAGAIFAGIIVGAKIPLSLVSRADPAISKLASISLAVVFSNFKQSLLKRSKENE